MHEVLKQARKEHKEAIVNEYRLARQEADMRERDYFLVNNVHRS